MDSYEVKEHIDKQDRIIKNLHELIRILTYEERRKDGKLCNGLTSIVCQIQRSSYEEGPNGETWTSWKKLPVKIDIAYLCKKLGVDIRLFNIERR